IEVSTWPKKFKALSQKTSSKEKEDFIFFRDFFIKDGNGNPLIRATSSWVMLDFKKKSPQPLSRVPYQFPINEGVHAIAVIPQKIPEAKNPTLIYSKRVGYSDIDLNLHVNNTRYADWVMDVFSHNFLESHILKSMEINYIHEVFWGDIIDFFQGKGKNENSFIIEGIEKHTKKVSFRALMKFEDVCD
ncbi:MAG: thioesterase, partial [Candidatus Marinimicrobia bacterium]|nr:thioesterase [Candidatus Neomarinimicrobiota bacterium]